MYLQLLLLVHTALAKHEGFVGFTAWKQVTQEFDTGDRILFEGVLINEGDAYQPALSQFTCPVSGIYYISTNLMTYDIAYKIAVKVGEEDVMHKYSATSMSYNTASNSAVVYCQSGDRIYVQGDKDCSGCKIYGETGIPYSTFTVMLLSEQEATAKHSSFIGFSVAKGNAQKYENQDVITYPRITYTDGNWLDNVHRYTCNTEGVYFINFNSHVNSSQCLQLGVQKSTITYLHAQDVTNSNNWNTISNSGLIYCEVGESFVVKATGSGEVFGSTSNIQTTFSGFILSSQDLDALHTGVLGFSVFKKGSQNYTADETITFEGILWDDNNTYDRVRNRFECSKSGIYFVSVTFMRNDRHPLYVQVETESVPFLRSEEWEDYNPWNTISNSGLVRCFEGEEIKVVATGTGSVYGHDSEAITTFTLFLMFEY